jgi:hypothetical protein
VEKAPQSYDDEHADAHKRVESRDSMFLHGIVRHLGDQETAVLRVRNLSAGGLMADCPRLFERGEAVELELRGIGIVNGRIAWATEGRIGVAFEWKVDPKLARKPVRTRSDEPRIDCAPQGRRPGLRIG